MTTNGMSAKVMYMNDMYFVTRSASAKLNEYMYENASTCSNPCACVRACVCVCVRVRAVCSSLSVRRRGRTSLPSPCDGTVTVHSKAPQHCHGHLCVRIPPPAARCGVHSVPRTGTPS
jgi:hypothetical protein